MLTRRSQRTAKWSVIILVAFFLPGVITLPYSLRWFNVQELDVAVRHAPALRPVVPIEYFRDPPQSPLGKGRGDSTEGKEATRQGGNEAALSSSGRLLYETTSWLGHDDLGRSLLYRLMPGFLISLGFGGAAALMAAVIGTAWGAVAGLSGGRIDRAMMRVVDVLYGLPYILMVILLKTGLTKPLGTLFAGQRKLADLVILLVAIGGVSWLTMARVIRGQVLSLKTQPFIEAARVSGGGTFYIIRRHLVPNLIGPITVYATLVVPQAILQESFLSFLGIGVQQPTPTLGRLAADGVQAVNTFVGYWWLIAFPCGVLSVTLLALNFIGDALRDMYDPKSGAKMTL